MKKKKKRKGTEQRFKNTPAKSHEPTAFELAFKKAEGQTEEKEPVEKTLPIDSAPKSIGQTQRSVPPKPTPKNDLTRSAPIASNKKPGFDSSSLKQQNKKPAVQKKIAQKHKTISKAESPAARNKKSIKLGLKSAIDQDTVLNEVVSQGDDQSQSLPKGKKSEPISSRTQVHGGKPDKESDVVIGFDFGTSSSKIVIRDSGLQTAHAIPFGFLACSANEYLIPTRIFISENGVLSLSRGDHSYSNLKIHLMDRPQQIIYAAENSEKTITASELAAAYMALVLIFARAWFLKKTASIYKNTHIYWNINLGIPSRNYDDKEMKKTFQTIAMAAGRISRLDSEITIAEVKKYLKEAERHMATNGEDIDSEDNEALWLHPDLVNTHPEVIMEIVGYARSPLRTNGLHLIVDVGATTLDAATFIIHENEGEDVFPILDTAVEKLGTIMLHNERVDMLKNHLERSLGEVKNINPTNPLPEHSYYGVKLCEEEIFKCDVRFFNESTKVVGRAVQKTRDHRDPNSSVWKTELHVFVCGGGGRHILYKTAIEELGQRLSKAWKDFRGFAIRDIPKPDKLEASDLSHEEYDRLAVAYGLSFTSDEIGEVIPESKVSNITTQSPVLNVEDRYVSKDMC